MSSPAQIATNRQNAQLSTGPRTDEGKAASSQNGVSHGLSSEFKVLPHENQSDFETLTLKLYEQFNPQGEHETFIVTEMAQARWRMARVDRLENLAFEFMLGESSDSPDGRIIAYMSRKDRDPLTLLARYKSSAERSYYKAVRELQHSRRANAQFQQKAMDLFIKDYIFTPAPGERAAAAAQSKIGFASQKPAEAAAPAANRTLRL